MGEAAEDARGRRSDASRWPSWLLPSFGDVVLLALFSLIRSVPAFDTDLWWHLRTGDLIIAGGAVPRFDTYSHTATSQPWIAHEWLAEVAMATAYGMAGLEAMATLQAVLLGLVLTFTYLHVRTSGALMAVYVPLLVLATLLLLPAAHPRPYLLTLVFLSLLLLLLRRWRQKPWALALASASLFAVWANVHAGFAIGLIALAIVGIGDTIERRRVAWDIAAILLLSTAATLANPYGARLLAYPLQYRAGSVHYALITEWAPVGLHQPYGWLVLSTAVVTAILLALRRAPGWQVDAPMLVVFGYLALSSVRNIPLLAVVAVPILARQIQAPRRPRDLAPEPAPTAGGEAEAAKAAEQVRAWTGRYAGPLMSLARLDARLTGVTLTAVVLATTLLGVARGPSDERAFDPASWPGSRGWDLPYEAVEVLPVGERDNLLNSYAWGGYVIWATASTEPVFVDGRADVYGEEILTDYASAVALAPGWDAVLDSYGVRVVLVPPDVPIAEALRIASPWRVVHEDDRSVLFAR